MIKRGKVLRQGVVAAGFAAFLSLTGAASTSQAAYYQVFTNRNITADIISSSDNYCSLAEAAASVNSGSPVNANCRDLDSTNPGQITLIASPGHTYANTHFNLRNAALTFTRGVRIQPSEEGFVAYIDSSGPLAIKISVGVEAYLYGLNLSHTGTASGRLLWNAGTTYLTSSVVQNGNVKANSAGIGGGIYNEVTGTLSVYASQILGNQAKKGGGIYNDGGDIPYLQATISGNSATIAGGGLYNAFSSANPDAQINLAATISSNSANSGGGIANVGGTVIIVGPTTITKNFTVAGANSSDEICHLGTCTPANKTTCNSGPCAGNGAGVLNVNTFSHGAQFDVRTTDRATISANTATQFGGGIYNTGLLNLTNITMGGSTEASGNKAKSGAAVFAAALVDANHSPQPNYCEFDNDYGPPSFRYNKATGSPSTSFYSIVDTSGADQTFCKFAGASGSNNSKPYCNPAAVRTGFACPQTSP